MTSAPLSSLNATAANRNAASHRKATANSNPDAPVELADRYIVGKGVPRSCETAVRLLQSAAAKANVRACNRLASMYAIGICVPRDRIQAYRWLGSALAADPHNEWALLNRDLTLAPDDSGRAKPSGKQAARSAAASARELTATGGNCLLRITLNSGRPAFSWHNIGKTPSLQALVPGSFFAQ